MDLCTDIGTVFTDLTRDQIAELAATLNEMGDRCLFRNDDGSIEIKPPFSHPETPQDEIERLKRYLADTDYTVVKCMELGVSVADTYPEITKYRAEARARINVLEEQ